MNDHNVEPNDLLRFRDEADRLRKAGRQKGSMTKEVRERLTALVSRVLATPGVDIERIGSDLGQFPPSVVGHAVADQWASLAPERLAVLNRRLESLEAGRQAQEKLALALSLLKRQGGKDAASELLATLPPTKETLARLRDQLLAEDSRFLDALEAPGDEKAALSLWKLLLKAADDPKAQEYRRFGLLKKVLRWLAQDQRFERTESLGLIGQVRSVHGTLSGRVADQAAKDLDGNEAWSFAVRGTRPPAASDSPAAPAKPDGPGETAISSSSIGIATSVPAEVPPPQPKTEVGAASEATLSLEEAEAAATATITRLRHEALVVQTLLGGIKKAQVRGRQCAADLVAARDAERNALIKADESKDQVEGLKEDLAKMRKERDERERRAGEAQRQVVHLEGRLKAMTSECERLTELLREAEEQAARDRKAWEQRVVSNADAQLEEFKRGTAARVNKLTTDVPPRTKQFPDTLTSVLNDRLHEVFDALRAEGINIVDRG